MHLLGGPIAILQTVAWASMLVSYSVEDGLLQGVTDTFSGERPCGLCLQVREMEHDDPAPALPAGDERRRAAEALGQSIRVSAPIEMPRPGIKVLAWLGRISGGAMRPEGLGEDPETPPPEGRA